MGRFNDLPKDVKWIVFIQALSFPLHAMHLMASYECTQPYANRFHWPVAQQLSIWALLSKECFNIVRSKCYKAERGWVFRKGALTQWF